MRVKVCTFVCAFNSNVSRIVSLFSVLIGRCVVSGGSIGMNDDGSGSIAVLELALQASRVLRCATCTLLIFVRVLCGYLCLCGNFVSVCVCVFLWSPSYRHC